MPLALTTRPLDIIQAGFCCLWNGESDAVIRPSISNYTAYPNRLGRQNPQGVL